MSKFMKKLTSTTIALAILLGMATPVLARVAQDTITINYINIRIAINGQLINTEFAPFVFQGRTYLPVRDVASAMGFHVTWEDATNTVHLTSGTNVPQQTVNAPGRVAQETIVVNFNNIQFAVNSTLVSTEYYPFIFQGRTYLPVRDVANATGFDVSWDDATNTVLLTSRAAVTPNYPPHQPVVPNYPARQPTTSTQGNRPQSPAISLERAIEIGYAELARRGHTGTFRNHSGMDFEPRYGGWVWEILFRVPGGRLPLVEMYICVHTGNVAKFEWDD